MPAKEPKP